jgi:hypothetical protein
MLSNNALISLACLHRPGSSAMPSILLHKYLLFGCCRYRYCPRRTKRQNASFFTPTNSILHVRPAMIGFLRLTLRLNLHCLACGMWLQRSTRSNLSLASESEEDGKHIVAGWDE